MFHRMIFLAALLAAVCAPPPGTHLVPVVPAAFSPADSTLLAANTEAAGFLAGYEKNIRLASDSVRVRATDAVRARLGSEWFCFPGADGLTHAVFGRYDTLRASYDAVFHYTVDPSGRVARSSAAAPVHITLPRARAVHTALSLAAGAAARERVALVPFVRNLSGDTLEVRLLPGADPDGTLLYGLERTYRFDAAGTLLPGSTAVSGGIRGLHPARAARVTLVNRQRTVPTAGQLFFLLAYGGRFEDIRIENRASLTYRRRNPDGTFRWIHAATFAE